jgi:hypothetical protein
MFFTTYGMILAQHGRFPHRPNRDGGSPTSSRKSEKIRKNPKNPKNPRKSKKINYFSTVVFWLHCSFFLFFLFFRGSFLATLEFLRSFADDLRTFAHALQMVLQYQYV